MNSNAEERMIVDQSYWDNSYAKLKFFRLAKGDPTSELIRQYIPRAKDGAQAFEIGCFPGRFIAEIGELGYTLNGCDLTPRVSSDLEPWLREQGFKVGEISQASYESFADRKYDLVASFGFIEHFENHEEIFRLHCNMVADGGFLIVQFPNFRGSVQEKLHSFFDRDNLGNHVLSAMDVVKYEKVLPREFEVLYCGYYGNFDFWIDDFKKRNGMVKRRILKTIFKTRKLWNKLPNDERWSPHGMIIARRKATP